MAEGVGYAHISDDTRKGKNERSEGSITINKVYKMKKQTELRNKYQQRVGANDQPELFKKKKREMSGAERVFTFQSKLYQKAKQERGYSISLL